MKLDDVDPELFAIVVNWIYSKEVKNDRDEPDLVTCTKSPGCSILDLATGYNGPQNLRKRNVSI